MRIYAEKEFVVSRLHVFLVSAPISMCAHALKRAK